MWNSTGYDFVQGKSEETNVNCNDYIPNGHNQQRRILPLNVTDRDDTSRSSHDDPTESLWWATQWLIQLPIFILSGSSPWIYAYHSVDLKRCMQRYVRNILVGLKLISREATSNAGIFATGKLDRSYLTTAHWHNSLMIKSTCGLHHLSMLAPPACLHGNAASVHRKSVCTCDQHRGSILSLAPTVAMVNNITLNVSLKNFNGSRASIPR